MKPIFTIHAGEYLVGTYIEKNFKDCEIWIPAKDTGIDLLITNSKDRTKQVSIQVKFSKDFLPEMKTTHLNDLSACGWWTLNPEKIKNSPAEYWIITPYNFLNNKNEYIIIEPKELYKRLIDIHGSDKKMINTYLWVFKNNKCFDTRGLKQNEINMYVKNEEIYDKNRDFSSYLNDWAQIKKKLL